MMVKFTRTLFLFTMKLLMKQKECETEKEHFMLGEKKYNVDSNYSHRGAMLGGSIKLPGTSWQKK